MRRGDMLAAGRRLNRWRAVVAACGALLGTLALGLLLGCAPTRATGATGTSTPMTSPTATSVPCPAATEASAAQRRLATAVSAMVGSVPCLDIAYKAADRSATVTMTIAGRVPISPADIAAAQERGKTLCFQAQRAAWVSGVALSAVTVVVVGPYMDPYAGLTTAPYAATYLTGRTAASFAWANLSPDSAWGKYDSTFLQSGFYPTDGRPTAVP